MAANSQQFGDGHETPIRRVNKVGINSDIQQQLATLTTLVQTMAMRDNLPRPCGVCSMVEHMTDMCPSLQDGGSYEQANALRGFQGQQNFQRAPRPRNDPYSNTYNPGWRNHLNFSYANNSNQAAPSMPYNKPSDFTQLMISKLNILINPCTKNNKLLGIVEARVES